MLIYKIAKLLYLNSVSPYIEYIEGNKEFNTLQEARAAKPKDNEYSSIYIIVEIEGEKGSPQKVRLV